MKNRISKTFNIEFSENILFCVQADTRKNALLSIQFRIIIDTRWDRDCSNLDILKFLTMASEFLKPADKVAINDLKKHGVVLNSDPIWMIKIPEHETETKKNKEVKTKK